MASLRCGEGEAGCVVATRTPRKGARKTDDGARPMMGKVRLSWSESARSTAWQLPFGQIVMLLTDMIDRRFLAAGSQHSAKGKGQRAKPKGSRAKPKDSRAKPKGQGRPRGKSAPCGYSTACSWVTAFNIGRS
ncbi:hypothetical protein HYQ46_011566 [Verticillium longisporum]|nr:hypothetical protein HYQ46_011566 [Verticillium longisporum]